jgi:hypothetical protein
MYVDYYLNIDVKLLFYHKCLIVHMRIIIELANYPF